VPDFDDPHLRHDAQQRHIADGAIGRVDDRVRIGVLGRRALGKERRKRSRVVERSVAGNVGPQLVMSGECRPQIGGVPGVSFSKRP
jgi:hypothetical protein